jgi:hypothetical protein
MSRSYRVESSNWSPANAMFDHSLEFDPVMAGDLKFRVAPMKIAYDNFHKFSNIA